MLQQLIADVKTKLNIQGSIFIDAEIESYIKDIDPSQYLEFFKALSGDQYAYKNAMDRIAMVAEQFKQKRDATLFGTVEEQARELEKKFTSIRVALQNYTIANRNDVPSDRVFFAEFNYGLLRDVKDVLILSSAEVEILEELGGGDFLLDMQMMANSKEVRDRIEKVLKHRIRIASIPESNQIAGNVRKAISA
jgi:hypothetical protein